MKHKSKTFSQLEGEKCVKRAKFSVTFTSIMNKRAKLFQKNENKK